VLKLIDPHTKEQENFNCFLLDCEGTNSMERDTKLDSMLLCLSILISSTLIYNTIGVIDEKSLDTLATLIKIAQDIFTLNKG
jgi:Guanylate-binding protein, N-terminal domain